MENFINEFKTYCETVENTTALEKIKQHYFDYMLDLETFVDDHIEINLSKASNKDIIDEANRLSVILKSLIKTASCINNIDARDVYLLFYEDSKFHIKEVFDEVMQSCYSQLYKKVYPNEIDLYKYELEESDLPKWYIDLCNILDKYGI
ncbi:hypothetical protein [uncultured Clostridium sp.]|jgi:hypothetical protein|uniref:hypothetical protein n=1 Tax=uncultured Clostridium sp. TaxID=59620 RepID=UPI0025FB330F|nr:hypothetical protein [uncultured Clostridium sp.]